MSAIKRLPIEAVSLVMNFLSWRDRRAFCASCTTFWKQRRLWSFDDHLLVTDQTLQMLSSLLKTTSLPLESCFYVSSCSSLSFVGCTFNSAATYVILRTFQRISSLDVSTIKFASDKERIATLRMVHQLHRHCVLVVSSIDFLSWVSIQDDMPQNTITLARKPYISNADDSSVATYDHTGGLDLFLTPPGLARSIKIFKDSMKQEYLMAGKLRLRPDSVTIEDLSLPRCASKHLVKANYQRCDDPLPVSLHGVLINDKQRLETTIIPKVAEKFMESVVVCGSHWIVVTQFDIFLTNTGLDDCAYHQKGLELENLTVNICSKREGTSNWNELIIQNGPCQLLVTGGLVGRYGCPLVTPFLGSSIPCSPCAGPDPILYTRTTSCSFYQTYRYLRNYKRVDARLKFGFISKHFKDIGFVACHPVFYNEHLKKSPRITMSALGSRIIASYVSLNTSKEEVADMLELLKKTAFVSKIMKPGKTIASINQLYDAHAAEITNSGTLTKSVIQKLCLMEEAANIVSPVNMNLFDDESGPSLLDIYNGGLNHCITTINRETIKSFFENHL